MEESKNALSTHLCICSYAKRKKISIFKHIPESRERPDYPSTKTNKMKVIVVVALVVSVSAILSYNHGVPTLGSVSGNSTEAITVTDGNKNIFAPGMNLSGTDLNPAHGQPGHRCDIGVGQPLSSKPATQPFSDFKTVKTAATPITKPLTINPAPVFNPYVATAHLNPPHGQPGHRCDISVGMPLDSKPLPSTTASATTPTNNTSTVAPGMNPAHGQPGHRCDIGVGQPLDSKPLASTTSSSITPTKNTSTVKAGMNPPHGQPGHRCDILVGQPLDSKPLASTTSPTSTPTITPTKNTSTVAPGMNPAHGQPGHRCDIAVGQPLNSKPSSKSLWTPPTIP